MRPSYCYGIIIILIIIILHLISSDYDIYGLYIADDYYLNDANLKKMTLFIGDINREATSFTNTAYNAYLFISADKVIEDQKVLLYLSRSMSIDGCYWYKLTVEGSSSWDNKPMQMRICPKKQLLTVMHDDTIYGEMYKDNALTDFAKNIE